MTEHAPFERQAPPYADWSENEKGEGAEVKLKVPGVAGKRIVITSLSGSLSAPAEVAAAKAIVCQIKRGAIIVFRTVLMQNKTAAGVAQVDRFFLTTNVILEPGEELLFTAEAGAAGVTVNLNAAGYFE